MDRETLHKMANRLRKEGRMQFKIASILSVTQTRVIQILEQPEDIQFPQLGGYLKSLLSEADKQQLLGYLDEGALAQGFENDCWTSKRGNTLIERTFGISYTLNYIPDLLRKLG